MRYIKIKDLQPGMILAQPLLNKRGDVFLARNVSVNKFMVRRIKEEQYRGVYVYDKLSKGINPKNQIPAVYSLRQCVRSRTWTLTGVHICQEKYLLH